MTLRRWSWDGVRRQLLYSHETPTTRRTSSKHRPNTQQKARSIMRGANSRVEYSGVERCVSAIQGRFWRNATSSARGGRIERREPELPAPLFRLEFRDSESIHGIRYAETSQPALRISEMRLNRRVAVEIAAFSGQPIVHTGQSRCLVLSNRLPALGWT